jgi:hypothetical protein
MRPVELEQFADAFEHRERGVAQAIARERRDEKVRKRACNGCLPNIDES